MKKTHEKMVQELWDIEQIRKLMARYVYYSYARLWNEVPGMFAQRDDIWVDCEGFGTFDAMPASADSLLTGIDRWKATAR